MNSILKKKSLKESSSNITEKKLKKELTKKGTYLYGKRNSQIFINALVQKKRSGLDQINEENIENERVI